MADGRTDMSDDVRARLIAATAELIEQRGPLGVRVDEIAERARCSRATLYRHAADKDELVREVIVARTTVMAGIVAHQIDGISDPTERVAQGMLLFADALRSESWFKALQNDSDGSYPLARIGGGLEAMGAAISPLIEALLHEYVDSRHLREDVNLHDAVEWLMGILVSLLAPAFAAHSREHRLAMLKRYAIFPLIKPQHE
ncbi:TetR/AcrR family transcriptional regulator [Mycobacterium marseillense]|uniref:TetR/AcrR family transcriptional regulator n=1 Tax=Mycobacterium marseillense TaxID=701042 RepID=UPI0012FD4907|nr:TetR/AcrR family transcriptional regulator [Mycobacterium marseillense]